MFEEILLAVDGSEHALNAARMASNLANAVNSRILRIVFAFERVPSYLGEPNMQIAINNRLKETEEILRKVMEEVGNVSADIRTEPIEGDAAEAIIEVAKTYNSNVIVMGSRGLGGLAGMLLGSTSQKVVSHAPCPVLIVR